jgi:protein required for attachment to host cells
MRTKKTRRGVEIKRTAGMPQPRSSKTWILVAHRAGARLVEYRGPGHALEMVERLTFPAGRLKDRDFRSDQPGRSFESGARFKTGHSSGSVRHALSNEVSQTEQRAIAFAHDLAARLEKGRTESRYAKLVLVAGPKFMGRLNAALSKETRARICQRLERDLGNVPTPALKNRLSQLVAQQVSAA